jgi:dihydrofolate synthase/folylpolyglutamate synthase
MRFNHLQDWLTWQEGLHPSLIELGLERVGRVWDRLGPRVLPFPVITVAGTNGKGSTVAMLEAIYGAAGYRTAAYTSPHLMRYNERIRLNGQEVEDQDLCEAFARVDAARDRDSLTYFEFGTLAALDIFLRAGPDLAILEVGLGGRLDAVNLIDADLAIVTSIGRDHMAWLGETLEEIALEKAGILRPGRPVVFGHRKPLPVLLERAADLGCSAHVLGRDFDWTEESPGWRWTAPGLPPLSLAAPALRGRIQFDNAASAIMATACLRDRLTLSSAHLRQGLQRARIPGRFQVLPGAPTWILDVAHNGPAAQALAANLASFPCQGRLHAVLGLFADKEPTAVAGPLLEWVDCWHLGAADSPRALPAPELRVALNGLGAQLGRTLNIREYGGIEEAVAGARGLALSGDCILAFGSFTTVEAVLRQPPS